MRVLIVGCSHTCKSWETQEDGVERIGEQLGWWEHLPKVHEYTVYGQVGSGYLGFATILSELDRTRRLANFDLCIIQETIEPRIVFYLQQDDEDYEETTYDNITYRQLGGAQKLFVDNLFSNDVQPAFKDRLLQKYNMSFNEVESDYLNRLVNNAHTSHIIQSSVSLCNRLLEKNNVRGYYFSFNSLDRFHRYMKKIDIPLVTEELFFDERYHNFDDNWCGHLNYAGNKKLGTMITKEMKGVL